MRVGPYPGGALTTDICGGTLKLHSCDCLGSSIVQPNGLMAVQFTNAPSISTQVRVALNHLRVKRSSQRRRQTELLERMFDYSRFWRAGLSVQTSFMEAW
jgi:hypothetical protein